MPEVAAGGYSPGEDSASHAVCARALKLAAQYQTVNDVQQASCLYLPECCFRTYLLTHQDQVLVWVGCICNSFALLWCNPSC